MAEGPRPAGLRFVGRRHPWVVWGRVHDSVVLHDTRTSAVFGLNHSAAAVWQHLDGVTPVAEIGRLVASRFAQPVADVQAECARCVGALRAQGLVVAAAAPVDPMPRARQVLRRLLPPPGPGEVRLGPYAALGHRFVVDGAPGPELDRAASLLASFPTAAEADRVHRVSEADALVREISLAAVDSVRGACVFHAGAVARDGRVLVLVAPSGSGKSTLVAGLVQAGWEYLSDEVVAIDRRGVAIGVRKPISLREPVWPLFPAAASGVSGGDARFVDPDEVGPGGTTTHGPVAGVVLPTYDPTARSDAELVVLPPPVAATRLLANSFPIAGSPSAAMAALCAVVSRTSVAEVRYSSLRSAITALEEFQTIS